MPMEIIGSKGILENELSYSRISSSYFEHPALSMFNDPRNGSLADAQIKKWLVMDESKVRNDPNVTTLARLANGQPILAEKKFGKGVVMFWGTSIDTDWTNLQHAQAISPLLNKLLLISLKKSSPQNGKCWSTYYSLYCRTG